jgi:hypothetical protein
MMNTCQVIAFPAARRVGHVNKLARLMASYSERGGERMLNMQLARQYRAMVRRNIPSEIIERELRSLELAIRARLWTIVMQGGDAA